MAGRGLGSGEAGRDGGASVISAAEQLDWNAWSPLEGGAQIAQGARVQTPTILVVRDHRRSPQSQGNALLLPDRAGLMGDPEQRRLGALQGVLSVSKSVSCVQAQQRPRLWQHGYPQPQPSTSSPLMRPWRMPRTRRAPSLLRSAMQELCHTAVRCQAFNALLGLHSCPCPRSSGDTPASPCPSDPSSLSALCTYFRQAYGCE